MSDEILTSNDNKHCPYCGAVSLPDLVDEGGTVVDIAIKDIETAHPDGCRTTWIETHKCYNCTHEYTLTYAS